MIQKHRVDNRGRNIITADNEWSGCDAKECRNAIQKSNWGAYSKNDFMNLISSAQEDIDASA